MLRTHRPCNCVRGLKTRLFVSSALQSLRLSPPATPTAGTAIVARPRARRWSSLRPARMFVSTIKPIASSQDGIARAARTGLPPHLRRQRPHRHRRCHRRAHSELVIDGQVIEFVVAFRRARYAQVAGVRHRDHDAAHDSRAARSIDLLLAHDSVRRPRPRPRRRRGRPRLRSDRVIVVDRSRRPVFILELVTSLGIRIVISMRIGKSAAGTAWLIAIDAQRLRGIRQWFLIHEFRRLLGRRTKDLVPQTHGSRLRRLFTHGSRRLGSLLGTRFFNFLGGWTNFPIGFALCIEISRRPTVIRSILADRADPGFRRADARERPRPSPRPPRLPLPPRSPTRFAIARVVRVLRAADRSGRRLAVDPFAARSVPGVVGSSAASRLVLPTRRLGPHALRARQDAEASAAPRASPPAATAASPIRRRDCPNLGLPSSAAAVIRPTFLPIEPAGTAGGGCGAATASSRCNRFGRNLSANLADQFVPF